MHPVCCNRSGSMYKAQLFTLHAIACFALYTMLCLMHDIVLLCCVFSAAIWCMHHNSELHLRCNANNMQDACQAQGCLMDSFPAIPYGMAVSAILSIFWQYMFTTPSAVSQASQIAKLRSSSRLCMALVLVTVLQAHIYREAVTFGN